MVVFSLIVRRIGGFFVDFSLKWWFFSWIVRQSGGFFIVFSFSFRDVFLFFWGSFSDAILRRFGSQHLAKMRICVFCCLLIFVRFSIMFAFRRVLFSSSVGSFFASFLASIFCCFLDRFGGHFGRLLGVQIGHFGHRFLASIFELFLV